MSTQALIDQARQLISKKDSMKAECLAIFAKSQELLAKFDNDPSEENRINLQAQIDKLNLQQEDCKNLIKELDVLLDEIEKRQAAEKKELDEVAAYLDQLKNVDVP
jgi:hypothetical protein